MIKIVSYTFYTLLLFFLTASQAFAHVYYIAEEEAVEVLKGSNLRFFLEPLRDPDYLILIALTVILILALFALARRLKTISVLKKRFHKKAEEYNTILPWILRLSAGIMLIGAGTNGWLISPFLDGPEFAVFGVLQIFTGFLLLSGFLTTLASAIVLALYGVALMVDPYLIGSLEILALSIALIIRDSRFPGVDDLFKVPDFNIKEFSAWVPTILRVGIGIGLMYLALFEKILNPLLSAYVVRITDLMNVIPVSEAMWVFSAGMIEFAVGFLLFLGYRTRIVGMIAFLVLSLSFFYFGEDVVSHITLFGVLSVLIVEGGGKMSLDAWRQRRRGWFKAIKG